MGSSQHKSKMNTLFNDDRPCTIQELENIITSPSGGLKMLPNSAYDEVTDGIYVGEGDSARSINCMKRLAVTHVLNAALGKDMFHVNTNPVMYKRANIQFLGIEATDFLNYDLSKYFTSAADFIDAGVQGGGKVFVHCVQGVSRSATLVVAYLMIKKHMTVQDALRLVREKRMVCPNPGFLQQLCDLNEKLKKSGCFKKNIVVDSLQGKTEELCVGGAFSRNSGDNGGSPVLSEEQSSCLSDVHENGDLHDETSGELVPD